MSTPKESSPASRLTRTPEGLIYTGESLTYRVTGLTAYNLDRIFITLKASPADRHESFHVDKLDLYNSRNRETFAENCAKYLKAQHGEVMADLSKLITALEGERIAMKEKGKTAEVPPMSEEEKAEALAALKSKDLLKIILAAFEALGYIGEVKNKLLGFFAAISRLIPKPLAILFLSRPGSGKTEMQNVVCKLAPPEAVAQYTRITGSALYYRDANALKHKILAIEEEGGLQEAMYSVKNLITAQKLTVSTTRPDAKSGKFTADDYTVCGPVVVMVSATNPDTIDDETKSRFMTLTIDESKEQTKKILQAQFAKNTREWYTTTADEDSVVRLHHNMQRLLKPLTVVFSRELKIVWPYGRLQMRREQGKFLSLVKAIVILHQHQRKISMLKRIDGVKIECVEATQKDIDLALELGAEIFARNVDDVSPMGRTLLAAVGELIKEKIDAMRTDDPKREIRPFEVPFTRKELRDRIGWSEPQVRRTLEQLVELGYTGKLAGRQGSTFRYVLLDDGTSDPEIFFGSDEDEENPSTKNQ